MRRITAFLFVLSGEKKETPEGKPGRLEGSMRPGSAGGKEPTWLGGDGAGLPKGTVEHALNCPDEPSSDGEGRSIVLSRTEPGRSAWSGVHRPVNERKAPGTFKADDFSSDPSWWGGFWSL